MGGRHSGRKSGSQENKEIKKAEKEVGIAKEVGTKKSELQKKSEWRENKQVG